MRWRDTLVIPAVRREWVANVAALSVALVLLAAEAVFAVTLGSYGVYALALVVGWYALRALRDLNHLPLMACDELRQMEVQNREDHPELWDAVEKTAAKMGMPMPKIWIFGFVDCFAASWNCFREKAIAIDVMVLARMDSEHIEALVGHELAHIKNRDQPVINVIQNASLAFGYGGLALYAVSAIRFVLTGQIGFAVAAVICGALAVAAFKVMTRVFRHIVWQQEYAADALGAHVTGEPLVAARVLMLLELQTRIALDQLRAEGFAVVDDPRLSDHPPTSDRVYRLLQPR